MANSKWAEMKRGQKIPCIQIVINKFSDRKKHYNE